MHEPVHRGEAGAWELGARLDAPSVHPRRRGRLLTVEPDQRGNLSFDQGYLDRRGRFHLWPPLLALYPTAFTAGMAPELYSGIGGSVAVDPRNGDIWGADYMGRRLNRLSPVSPSLVR